MMVLCGLRSLALNVGLVEVTSSVRLQPGTGTCVAQEIWALRDVTRQMMRGRMRMRRDFWPGYRALCRDRYCCPVQDQPKAAGTEPYKADSKSPRFGRGEGGCGLSENLDAGGQTAAEFQHGTQGRRLVGTMTKDAGQVACGNRPITPGVAPVPADRVRRPTSSAATAAGEQGEHGRRQRRCRESRDSDTEGNPIIHVRARVEGGSTPSTERQFGVGDRPPERQRSVATIRSAGKPEAGGLRSRRPAGFT